MQITQIEVFAHGLSVTAEDISEDFRSIKTGLDDSLQICVESLERLAYLFGEDVFDSHDVQEINELKRFIERNLFVNLFYVVRVVDVNIGEVVSMIDVNRIVAAVILTDPKLPQVLD